MQGAGIRGSPNHAFVYWFCLVSLSCSILCIRAILKNEERFLPERYWDNDFAYCKWRAFAICGQICDDPYINFFVPYRST